MGIFSLKDRTAYLGDVIASATGWGWNHIVYNQHNIQIRDSLKLSNADTAVKDVIYEVVSSGQIMERTLDQKYRIEKIVTRNGVSKKIRVIVSDRYDETMKTVGRIITSYPI